MRIVCETFAEAVRRGHAKYCEIPDCDRPVDANGLCKAHNHRRTRGRPMDAPMRPFIYVPCKVDGCYREKNGNDGYCQVHHVRSIKDRPMDEPVAKRVRSNGLCSHPGCNRKHHANGLCSMHEYRKANGFPMDGAIPRGATSKYGKGRLKDANGYMQIYVPKLRRYVAEHRLVMESHLGRALRPGETVHHRDGDRANNNIANLELWSKSHPPGQRIIDKYLWAVEFVEAYKDLIEEGLIEDTS